MSRKQTKLARSLDRWFDRVLPIQPPDHSLRWGYRDKVCLSAHWNGASWDFGLLAPVPGSNHRQNLEVIPIPNCPVHSDRVNQGIHLFQTILPPFSSFPLCFLAISGKQLTLVVKARGPTPATYAPAWLSQSVQEELKALGFEGLWANWNPSTGKRVFSSKNWQLLWGKPISRTEDGFAYGPRSFQQLIRPLHQQTMQATDEFFAIKPGDSVVDLYSGAGISLARWAAQGARTIGVELCGEAADLAHENSAIGITLKGRCSDRIPQLEKWTKEGGKTFLYVNPPRTGLEPEIIDWCGKSLKPSKIAYLSCNPGTLGRDLEELAQLEYSIEKVIPYDFFPQTHHVEALALVSRNASRTF